MVVLRQVLATARTLGQTVHGVSEMCIDYAVQDEVNGEVTGLHQVSDRHYDVEDVRVVYVVGGVLDEEGQQLDWYEEKDEENDDDDQGKGDTAGRLASDLIVVVVIGAPGRP